MVGPAQHRSKPARRSASVIRLHLPLDLHDDVWRFVAQDRLALFSPPALIRRDLLAVFIVTAPSRSRTRRRPRSHALASAPFGFARRRGAGAVSLSSSASVGCAWRKVRNRCCVYQLTTCSSSSRPTGPMVA